MPYRRRKLLAAVTLIEVMAAIVIVAIAVIGASGYRYYSTLDARRADFQNAAARIALLLCENWRGRGYDGATNYDPVTHLTSADLTVAVSGVEYESLYGLTNHLGQYEITTTNDGVHYWAALSCDDGADGLRTLNVVIAWAQRQTGSAADSAAARGLDKTFKLTTYVSE
jgi:Tfp pilus assembly protein PilV